jgi:hypothetical protein
MTNRSAWLTPYHGGVSQYDQDRNRGNGLPSAIPDDGLARIRAKLEEKAQKQAMWAGCTTGYPAYMVQQPPQPMPVQAGMQRTASAQFEVHRVANIAEIESSGFRRIAAGMYKQGHDIWELRHAEDGQGYCLVRKREERAVDLRTGGFGTLEAAEAGIIHTGQRRIAKDKAEEDEPEAESMPPPLEGEPEPPEAIPTDEFELDQAQELFDAHEIMHGREPVYDPSAPLPSSMVEVMENGGAGADDYNFLDEAEPEGAMEGMATYGDAPPGREEQVKKLKHKPGIENPYAVAWAQYNREKEGGAYADAAMDHQGVAPEGWEGTVKEMKKHKDISNPWALAWWMKDKGYEPHEGAAAPPGPSAAMAACGAADHGKPGHVCASAGGRGSGQVVASIVGMKILAVHDGGVAEGKVVEVLPMGDLLTDFGEGEPEPVALEQVLEPLLEMLRPLLEGHMHEHLHEHEEEHHDGDPTAPPTEHDDEHDLFEHEGALDAGPILITAEDVVRRRPRR